MYILDSHRLRNVRRNLERVDARDGGWTEIYRDSSSGQRWVLLHHHGEVQGGGIPFLRMDPPPAELSDWMSACFGTGLEDDAKGLAWELSTQCEQWPAALAWLEAHAYEVNARLVRLFLEQLEILHVRNRRPLLGKSRAEVEGDYAHFVALAQRARDLIGDA